MIKAFNRMKVISFIGPLLLRESGDRVVNKSVVSNWQCSSLPQLHVHVPEELTPLKAPRQVPISKHFSICVEVDLRRPRGAEWEQRQYRVWIRPGA